METLFVYGTLRDPAVQQRLIGRTLESTPAVLPNYRKDTNRVHPVALPDDTEELNGQVLHVTPDELRLLDVYEGSGYERVRVELKDGQQAWVYRGKQTES
jgi:gamma-glutamylcyclotransferase (GGCT)/AIG2-like uncharacterized protein YtfP